MEWIKCDDRLPPNDCYVLIATYLKHKHHPVGSMYFIQIASRMNEVWIDDYNCEIIKLKKDEKITHWMPLPDKPKANHE